MSKQAILWTVGTIVVVGVALGLIFMTGGSESAVNNGENDGVVDGDTATQGFVPDLINAAQQYNPDEELHIIAGEVSVGNGCMEISQTVDYSDGAATATIQFVAENPTPDAFCTEAIENRRFKATFNAPDDIAVEATYNGAPVELNLRPVPEGEDLEDFEVSTKG